MRRRNAVMAALSLIFLSVLLIAMALAVASGIGSLGPLVLGGFSYAILVGVVVLAFPIIIFAMITIVLLTIEASRATWEARTRWWSRGSKPVATAEGPPSGGPR